MTLTDTPTTTQTFPPPPTMEQIKTLLGDLARPFAIYSTSLAASIAVVILALKVSGPEAAVFIAAVFAGLGALYAAKSWEKHGEAKANAAAAVGVAQAQASTGATSQ